LGKEKGEQMNLKKVLNCFYELSGYPQNFKASNVFLEKLFETLRLHVKIVLPCSFLN